jgi:3',5'-cyclic AMP phosphodiesterase CpdA
MKQLRILHLSDIHFGDKHLCCPEDQTLSDTGYPSLFELLSEDLKESQFEQPVWKSGNDKVNPLIVAVSGDLTEAASHDQFKDAHSFLNRFDGSKLLGATLSLRNLFVVPGNHDVQYDAQTAEERLTPYANFYSKLYRDIRSPIMPDEADKLSQIHVDAERGFIVAEINSAYYVQQGTYDAQRGNVDMQVIKNLRNSLSVIPEEQRGQLVRIAIIHHHPILVPALVEGKRGYDAVANSHHLLKLLREFGFHIVLHGHKHFPHIFSYDTDSPWSAETPPAMVVVGGGSSTSRELPSGARRCNTYNLISIKWHPEAEQARVRIVTRGLITEDDDGELTPDLWRWTTLREVDRRLYPRRHLPEPVASTVRPGIDRVSEAERKKIYAATRLNMVVSEVLPSLMPEQAYEVRAWLVPHADMNGNPRPGWELPKRVVWSAGPKFYRKEILQNEDPTFCCSYNYWGSMVLQAEMHFEDESIGYGYTYARIPL